MLRGLALLALLAFLMGCEEERRSSPPATDARPGPPTTADPQWQAVVRDWYDNGLFDDAHTCAAVRETTERVPRRDHSPALEDIETYADLVCGDAGQPSAPATISHRFVHPLPYPAGPRYTVSVRPAGAFRGVRWARFSNDPSYVRSGQAGEASFLVLLPSRRYVVTSSTRLCTDPNDGCRQIGEPQARCSRSVEVTGSGRVEIAVVARSGRACKISVDH